MSKHEIGSKPVTKADVIRTLLTVVGFVACVIGFFVISAATKTEPQQERPTWSTQELQQMHPNLQKGLPRDD